MRLGVLLLLLLSVPTRVWAEWQVKLFLGNTFGGSTNLVGDVERATGKRKTAIGVSGGFVGDVFGIEADIGRTPGFFQAGRRGLVVSSSLTTLTGNVTVALPRRMTEFTLRPYFAGGAGVMLPRTKTFGAVLQLSGSQPTMDLGAGVTGFLTRRVGVNWDVRRFRTFGGKTAASTTIDGGAERLSFWRADMALAFRY